LGSSRGRVSGRLVSRSGRAKAEAEAERRRNAENVQRLTIRTKTLEYSKVLDSYRPDMKVPSTDLPGHGAL